MKKMMHRWLSVLLTLSIVLSGAMNVFATGTKSNTALTLGTAHEQSVSITQDGDEATFTYTAEEDGTYILYFRELSANPIGLSFPPHAVQYHHHPGNAFQGHIQEMKAGETIGFTFAYPQPADPSDLPDGYSGYAAMVGVTTPAEESTFSGFSPMEPLNENDPNIYTPIEDGTLGLKFYTNDPFAYGVEWSATSANSDIVEFQSEWHDAVSFNPVFKLKELGTTSITITATYGQTTKSVTYSVEVFERGTPSPEGPNENNRFTSMDELEALLQDPDQSDRTLFYRGDSALEIDSDLELPEYISLEFDGRDLVVKEGATLKMYRNLQCGNLIVDGTLIAEDRFNCYESVTVSGTLNAKNGFRAGEALIVTGSVILANDGIQMEYPASISGIDKVSFGEEWHRLRVEIPYSNMTELEAALTDLKTNYVANDRVEYQLYMSSSNGSKFVINKDLTIPEYVEWQMREQPGFQVAAGTTLTVEGMLAVRAPLTVEGTLINKGLINLDHMNSENGILELAENSNYTGQDGELQCHTGASIQTVEEVLVGFYWDQYYYDSNMDNEGITHWHIRYGTPGPDEEQPGHAVAFANVAELKQASTEYAGEEKIILAYTGSSALEIAEEIIIPDNCELELNGKDLIVAKNGVLKLGLNLNCENLTVAGELIASERFCVGQSVTVSGSIQAEEAFHAGQSLTITGNVSISRSSIGMNYPASISGIDNIQFAEDWMEIRIDVPYGSFEELKARLDELATNYIDNDRVKYDIRLPDEAKENMSQLVISENITIPEYAELHMETDIEYIVEAGKTVTNNGDLTINTGLIVNGQLINNGNIHVHYMENQTGQITQGTNGSLNGSGTIHLHANPDVMAWEDMLPGVDLTDYDVIDQHKDDDNILHTNLQNIAGLIKLGTPINLTWGIEYREQWQWNEDTQSDDFLGYETFIRPGFTTWDTVLPDQAEIEIKIYRVGESEPCAEGRWGFGEDFQPEHRSIDVFNINDLPSGTYYFTVQSIADYKEYRNSDVATSGTYTYVNPGVQLEACTNLQWEDRDDEFVAWMNWDNNADEELRDGYQIEFFWSETKNGEYEHLGGIGGRGDWNSEEPFNDDFLQGHEAGYYKFRVRVLSKDIEVACNSPWSEFSPVLDLTDIPKRVDTNLQDIIDDVNQGVNSSVEEIKAAVQAMDTRDLETALLTDVENDSTTQLLSELEDTVGGAAPVVVTQEAQAFNQSEVSIVGANLNNKADAATDPIQLVIDKPEKDHVIPDLYNSSVAVKFSMDLENVEDSENLEVPVKITLPIPDSINPEFLVIFHYHADGTHEIIRPYVYEKNGQFYADIVLTSFSDFTMTEHIHEWKDVPVEIEDATCGAPGVEIYECKAEGCDVTHEVEIPQLAEHVSIVKAEATSATYFDNGNIECYVCEACDAIFMDEEGNIPAELEDVLLPKLEIENNAATSDETFIELPEESLAELETLTVTLQDGIQMVLDAQTLSMITGDVRLEVNEIQESDLTEEQIAALKEKGIQKIFSATMRLMEDDTLISDFGGGKVVIRIPFSVQEGTEATDYQAWYIAPEGSMEQMDSKLVEEAGQSYMEITVPHFSEYVILYTGEISNDGEEDDSESQPGGNDGEEGSGESQPGGNNGEEGSGESQPGGNDGEEDDKESQPGGNTGNNNSNVDTGDHNPIGMYVCLMTVCAAGLVMMLIMKRKAQN